MVLPSDRRNSLLRLGLGLGLGLRLGLGLGLGLWVRTPFLKKKSL